MSRGGLLILVMLLAGCRDSPVEVFEEATEAAARGAADDMEAVFSFDTVRRLERHWSQKGISPDLGWKQIAEGLTSRGEPITRILGETIHGDYAEVRVSDGVDERAYYLRKIAGQWRLELGAGQRYRMAAPPPDAGPEDKKPDKSTGPPRFNP